MGARQWCFWAAGLVAILAAQELLAAPASPRSLEEDRKLLLQVKGDNWLRPSATEVVRDGKKVSIRYGFFCGGLENPEITIEGHEGFKKKRGALGVLWLNIIEGDTGRSSAHYFRLEERDKKRYFVITGNEADEEITFEYEFDGKALKLKGGEKVNTYIGPLDLAGEYKRGSGSVRK